MFKVLLIAFLFASSPGTQGCQLSNDLVLVDFTVAYPYVFVLTNESYHIEDGLVLAKDLYVYDLATNCLIDHYDFQWANPWLIKAGSMTQEGTTLFIGAYRATQFYPIDKRPFLYTYTERGLKKLWTGSYLTIIDFTQVAFMDIDLDGLDELVLSDGIRHVAYQYKYHDMWVIADW